MELLCECFSETLKINLLHRDVLLPFERLHFCNCIGLRFPWHRFLVAAAAAAATTC